MNEFANQEKNAPIPSTMVSPRDKRPGIMRGGILQIQVTRACDMACIGCTQGSNLRHRPHFMTPAQFEEACLSLRNAQAWGGIPDYFGVVGMFGGNPCVHPEFEKLCEIMRRLIPFEQRGIWTNNFMGKGKAVRETFCPWHSNLNVHMNMKAYEEMCRDWPEARPFVKGHTEDSRHSPPYVAMRDMEDMTDEERWELISNCDVNQHWSAIVCVFRGELRGYFCEIAGAQAMLHEHDAEYPDLGVRIEPGWWNKPMAAFESQVRQHCFDCGHPLRGRGDLAVTGTVEQVSKTHADIYKLKRPQGKTIELITKRSQLGHVSTATQYLSKEKEWNRAN